MFEQWGFLLAEIWLLLGLSAVVGLIAGWFMFGGGSAAAAGDVGRLQAENANLQSRITALETQRGDNVASSSATLKAPQQLDAPRGGTADDLKRISGIGPRVEQMCNMLGIWHYDQIAKWTDDQVAWVDENLQGFKGRATSDDWVAQAKVLAEGGETAFSKAQDAKVADQD